MTTAPRLAASTPPRDAPRILPALVGGYLVVLFCICILLGAAIAVLCMPFFSLARLGSRVPPWGAFGRPPFSG